MTPKYKEPIVLSYKIKLKTGLHIGGSKENLKIGGIDSPVVKHPITGEPYIPGSSIKGRMRALIEMARGEYSENGEKLEASVDPSKKVKIVVNKENKVNLKIDGEKQEFEVSIPGAFGAAGKIGEGENKKDIKIASRILVEDFVLTKDWKDKFEELKSDFFEDKAENSVPRFLSGNANPRHIERVPAGVEFKGKIVLTPVEGGDYPISEKELKAIVEEGIKLIEQFGLGGGVSRGNGRVEFEEMTED